MVIKNLVIPLHCISFYISTLVLYQVLIYQHRLPLIMVDIYRYLWTEFQTVPLSLLSNLKRHNKHLDS